jgi:hypothetical protein
MKTDHKREDGKVLTDRLRYAAQTIRRNARWLLRLTALIPIFLIFLIGFYCCTSRNYILEYRITKNLDEFSKNDSNLLYLNEIFGNEWRKICLQWPYGIKRDLENRFAERLSKVEVISPNENALWVFYNDNSASFVVISRYVMDHQSYPFKGTHCTTSQKPYMYAIKRNSEKTFYFYD